MRLKITMNQDKPARIEIRTTMPRKSAYVRACNGAKLVPTILAVLDKWAGFDSRQMCLIDYASGQPDEPLTWLPYDGRASKSIGLNLPCYNRMKLLGAEVFYWCDVAGHSGYVAIRAGFEAEKPEQGKENKK